MKNNILINPYKPYTSRGIGNIIEGISPFIFEKALGVFNIVKDIRYKNIMKRRILSIKLFGEISIETINRCNGTCSFCPVNKNLDTREFHLMKKELFFSIIEQLHNLDYKGTVSVYCNNEALLDKRIFDFSDYARKELPLASLVLSTNGLLLTTEKFYRIIPNLDLLIIDNYDDDLKLPHRIKEIYTICKNDDKYKNKVWIVLRKKNEILTTRGGQAKNRKKTTKTFISPCIYPFWQIAVRPTGEVSLCCNDPLGEGTLGNLNKESIVDVWNGHKYIQFRETMFKEGRKNLLMCKYCDTIVV